MYTSVHACMCACVCYQSRHYVHVTHYFTLFYSSHSKAVCWPCVEVQRRQEAMLFDKALVYVHATEGDPRTVEESRPTHSGWTLR